MGTTGNLLNKSWLRLHFWLRASLSWFSSLAMASTIRFRRRLLTSREKKSMVKMGRRIYELYKDGQNHWSEDSTVKEILQVLDESSQKKEELKARLQERKERHRDKVQKLREKGIKSEAGENSSKQNSKA